MRLSSMNSPLFSRLQRFAAARLSPEGAAGLHLTLGVAVMLAAAWLFGVIAEDVVSGERITLLDVALAHYLHRHASAVLTAGMLIVTHWHGMIGTGVMAGYTTLVTFASLPLRLNTVT